jgi:hypothetical protein
MAIPKILHFTWKTSKLPPPMAAIYAKWQALHPDWEIKLHTDASMRAFMAARFPQYLALYDGYDRQIQRADAFRCFILSAEGGVYADLDVDPFRSLNELIEQTDCFVGVEPEEHMPLLFNACGLPYLLCNAFMGSVPGHPFWDHMFEQFERCVQNNVLESTGPLALTGCALRIESSRPDVLLPDYWSPTNSEHRPATHTESFATCVEKSFRVVGRGQPTIVSHLWSLTWGGGGKPDPAKAWYNLHNRLKWRWRWRRHPELFAVDPLLPVKSDYDEQLFPPLAEAELPEVFIASPMKDAAPFLDRFQAIVENLDYPAEKIRIGIVVSESKDDTVVKVDELAKLWDDRFAGVSVQRIDVPFEIDRQRRRDAKWQLQRRAAIAKCRNGLVDVARGLPGYTLWIDADMAEVPPDAIRRLLAARRPVVMANCLYPNGEACDLNAFMYTGKSLFRGLYKFGRKEGLYQPPSGYSRRYLPDQAFLRITPLHGVGGTTLLVDNEVFRAGVNFPEAPYLYHIETEGFALMARAKGFEVAGLTDLVVTHPSN